MQGQKGEDNCIACLKIVTESKSELQVNGLADDSDIPELTGPVSMYNQRRT